MRQNGVSEELQGARIGGAAIEAVEGGLEVQAPGSAALNRVIDERNLTASMPPKIASAG